MKARTTTILVNDVNITSIAGMKVRRLKIIKKLITGLSMLPRSKAHTGAGSRMNAVVPAVTTKEVVHGKRAVGLFPVICG